MDRPQSSVGYAEAMDATATEIVSASDALPDRQREALLLHEQEGRAYDEIAAQLDTTRECVAQLIAHAWINLYDELRGTALASVSPSPECERGTALIAARDDGELDAASADGEWLEDHLEDCDRCGRAVEEMREARSHFRSSAAAPGPPASRRRVAVAAMAAALLLLAGVAVAVVRDDPPKRSADRAAGSAQGSDTAPKRKSAVERKADAHTARGNNRAKGRTGTGQAAASDPSAPVAASVPTVAPAGGSSGGQPRQEPAPGPVPGKAAVGAPQQASARAAKPASPPAAPPPPASTPSALPAEPPPAEEAAPDSPGRAEPSGKAVGHAHK